LNYYYLVLYVLDILVLPGLVGYIGGRYGHKVIENVTLRLVIILVIVTLILVLNHIYVASHVW